MNDEARTDCSLIGGKCPECPPQCINWYFTNELVTCERGDDDELIDPDCIDGKVVAGCGGEECEPCPTCDDGVQNADEDDIDCCDKVNECYQAPVGMLDNEGKEIKREQESHQSASQIRITIK